MPVAQARRQGEITTFAFIELGGREAALEYLNSLNPELQARPIDLATQSEAGFARVRTMIERLAR